MSSSSIEAAMLGRGHIERVAEHVWEIPRTFRQDMRVPPRLYADEDLLDAALLDNSIVQLVNTATLPGIVKYAIAMPDIHQGYGFPIGGVVATRLPEGVISPGGVGYDINCGVRLLVSLVSVEEVQPYLEDIASCLYSNCPSGVGAHGHLHLNNTELDRVLYEGSCWMLDKGYATRADLDRTEELGRIHGADAAFVSDRARERGRGQLGTLGAGNHFIEVDRVAEVYDDITAARLRIYSGNIAVQIHCGSRGLGHQICEDYVSRFQKTAQDYRIELPDRELVCAPFNSKEGQEYFCAMACAANFAFANRQLLAHMIRQSFDEVLAGKIKDFDLRQVYDIAHNMAKVEEHNVGGRSLRVCVHRKGAARAFGPGSSVLPDDLRDLGQPVLIPGSMGTASYALIGTKGAMEETFGSTCHGAGRVMSRARAKKMVRGTALRDQLKSRGILICAGSMSGLAEEAPAAYKDVAQVVDLVHKLGIGRKIARLEPLVVIKGQRCGENQRPNLSPLCSHRGSSSSGSDNPPSSLFRNLRRLADPLPGRQNRICFDVGLAHQIAKRQHAYDLMFFIHHQYALDLMCLHKIESKEQLILLSAADRVARHTSVNPAGRGISTGSDHI